MIIYGSNDALTILFGVIVIVLILPGQGEIPSSGTLPDLSDSLISINESISKEAELIKSQAIDNESIEASMQNLPLSFIENHGQSSENVKFMVKTTGQTVFFTPSGVIFSLSSGNNSSTVHMIFNDSSPERIVGEQLLPGKANFLVGNDSSKWIVEIPTFRSIRYKELYPGVDLVFKSQGGDLKHEFILSPESDPSRIAMAYTGQESLSLTENESLLIRTADGDLTDSAPICYQEIDGITAYIEGKYRYVNDHTIGFEIGHYDRGHPLVIDPSLHFSTYLGGSNNDSGLGMAIDSNGNAYITGHTTSTNFPGKNQIQAANAGSIDSFVAKINADGLTLAYCTYLGGSGDDCAKAIAVDGSGDAYITGYTKSANFPTKNAIQTSNAGSNDAFISKINADGSALAYSTYLGGSGDDYAEAIAVDGSGNAYITGYTDPASFPTKNPIQASNAGLWDAFVTKINADGSDLIYSTYLGGSGFEYGIGIATDNSGNAYITGPTYSTNFPTKNPIQTSNAGMMDAFVSKINSAGSALAYSTYLGGSFNDYAEDIAVDGSGNAYITGYTISSNFPTQKPIQASNAGIWNSFVTKINPTGSTLVYSTYLGGSGISFGHGIDVDSAGNAYITGETNSADFPILNPIIASSINSYDVFLSKINASGLALDYSTCLGGAGYDYAKGIAVDDFGNVYISGYTESGNFPMVNPIQAFNAGSKDAFMAVVRSSELIPRPSQVLSPVIGAIELSGSTNTCSNTRWCFWQHKGDEHEGKTGIGAADDSYAWDINLNAPAIDTDKGQPVYAAAPGRVSETYGGSPNADDVSATYGQVLIEHSYRGSKWWSGYLHLANIQVKRGQNVTTGTVIGYISNKNVPDGNNHLHFVVYTGANSHGNLISFDASIKPRYEYYGIDVNGDGKADLTDISGKDYINTLLSRGDGTYDLRTFIPWTGYATGAGIWRLDDIDSDGMIDLVHIVGGNFINTWFSKGDGTFALKYFQPSPEYFTGVGIWYITDANGDSMSDLVHISGGDFINTWVSNGDGTYSIKHFSPWPGYATGIGYWIMGDINGDTMADPLHLIGDFINSWVSRGDGTYIIKYFRPSSGYNTGIGKWLIGDINGDGKTDLMHIAGDSANTWISNGDGTFSIKTFNPWPGYSTGVGRWYAADVNGDGLTDLEHIIGGDFINSWISKGDGKFSLKYFSPWPGYGTALGEWKVGDANADGKTDLEHIVGRDFVNTWLSKGDGTFSIKYFDQSMRDHSTANGYTRGSDSNVSPEIKQDISIDNNTLSGVYGIRSSTDLIKLQTDGTAIFNQVTEEDLKRCTPESSRKE